MLLLGIDLETNGNVIEDDNFMITELGAVVWDTELQAPVVIEDYLIKSDAKIPEDIVELTGITEQMLQDYGIPLIDALDKLDNMLPKCDYVVAHNGNKFDKPALEKMYQKTYQEDIGDKLWLDTMTDIDYPKFCTSKNLTFLCAYHGFVNPFSHRAVFDVLAMFNILSNYEIDEVIEVAKSPIKRIQAQVAFKDKDLAKDAGFKWYPKSKLWVLEEKECRLSDVDYPFSTIELCTDYILE